MKICAVSDLHGRLPDIPKCDVLILAGDICPDFPARVTMLDPDLMKLRQMEWLDDDFRKWETTIPAAHIFATPGNHDWVHSFPATCRSRMFIDTGITIPEPRNKLVFRSFWFTPWVQHCGDWNYMANREQRRYYFNNIPAKLDVLVSHGPVFDVGDQTYTNEHAGCREMRIVVQKQKPRFVVFGHIHEALRHGQKYVLGNSVLYNASMWGEATIRGWSPVVFDI